MRWLCHTYKQHAHKNMRQLYHKFKRNIKEKEIQSNSLHPSPPLGREGSPSSALVPLGSIFFRVTPQPLSPSSLLFWQWGLEKGLGMYTGSAFGGPHAVHTTSSTPQYWDSEVMHTGEAWQCLVPWMTTWLPSCRGLPVHLCIWVIHQKSLSSTLTSTVVTKPLPLQVDSHAYFSCIFKQDAGKDIIIS